MDAEYLCDLAGSRQRFTSARLRPDRAAGQQERPAVPTRGPTAQRRDEPPSGRAAALDRRTARAAEREPEVHAGAATAGDRHPDRPAEHQEPGAPEQPAQRGDHGLIRLGGAAGLGHDRNAYPLIEPLLAGRRAVRTTCGTRECLPVPRMWRPLPAPIRVSGIVPDVGSPGRSSRPGLWVSDAEGVLGGRRDRVDTPRGCPRPLRRSTPFRRCAAASVGRRRR